MHAFDHVREMLANASRRQARRQAVAALMSMDEHLLRDIGVRRGNIERLVDRGRR